MSQQTEGFVQSGAYSFYRLSLRQPVVLCDTCKQHFKVLLRSREVAQIVKKVGETSTTVKKRLMPAVSVRPLNMEHSQTISMK